MLNHWVDADDRPLRREELPVADADTASFSDTDESFLVNQEYEGYMGNYGETLDYWYRRAALVLQTPLAEEAGRFVSDFDAALADALALASRGRGDELATRLQAAARALAGQRRQRGRALFAAFSKLAAALPDTGQARSLMEGFEWVDLRSADARALARLSARRGEDWTADLIDAWTQPADPWHRPDWRLDESSGADRGEAQPPWPRPLAPFLESGLAAGLSHALIDRMLHRCQQALAAADGSLSRLTPAQRSASLASRLQALCDLATALHLSSNLPGSVDLLVRHVLAHPLAYPLRRLRPLVQALPADGAGDVAKTLRDAVIAALRQALAAPERRADAVLVLDNAAYHHARLLLPLLRKHRRHLSLFFLSPYSPQLATIERVWKLTRRLATHNRHFPTLDSVLEAATACFRRWQHPNETLRRLCCIT